MCSFQRLVLCFSLVASSLVPGRRVIATSSDDIASVSAYKIRNCPMTLALAEVGQFARGRRSWYLSVNSAGQARLTIDKGRDSTYRSFDVSKQQLDDLRECLVRERFFDLQDDYGEIVADGSTDTLSVIIGDKAKTVHIHFLMNWVLHDPAKLREPAKAIRVWNSVRTWFTDSEAADGRERDRIVLDTVARLREKKIHP